jgi:asparagine synthase (glutamine-hydrolysing)
LCGIDGIAARSLTPAHISACRAMTAALAHRGPDSNGLEVIGNCVLGNTRLAILDLSHRGRQPMANADRSSWIAYNGECYNAAQLREWLVSRGRSFHSGTDTEVVLQLYDEIGDACVERLRGMFAFAIWDAPKNRLLLARDRLGIKPLYYALTADGIVFASEIKALLSSGIVSPRMAPHGVRAFLQLGHIPAPWTAIDGVHPLEPGHCAVWQDGKFQKSSYWDLKAHANGAGAKEIAENASLGLTQQLLDATRLHLISDVPVALFLSGGVDSAALGALAKRAGADQLTALTIGFEDSALDESEPSRRTAELLGIPHRVLKLTARETHESLDHAMWAMDQPTVDGLNAYWICRTAAHAGFKVALTGQGGDELFGGYASLRWFERFTHAASWLKPVPRGFATAMLDHDAFPFRWRKLSYLAGADDPFVAAELAVKIHFLQRDVNDLLDPGLAAAGEDGEFSGRGEEAGAHLREWAARAKGANLLEKVAYLDVHAHLEPRLLRDGDAMSMAHSLELRPVFLDHKLVEFVFAMPGALRMQHKRLLLDAMRSVMPEDTYREISGRPKRTFSFPFAKWLAVELRPEVEAAFSADRVSSAGILNPAAVQSVWKRFLEHPGRVGWSRVWSLFVLQRWCETMKVTR